MEVRRVTRAEWRELLARGRIKDVPSVAAYGLLALHEAGELDASNIERTVSTFSCDTARPVSRARPPEQD